MQDLTAVATGDAWWFLDCLMVELPRANADGPLTYEGTLPAGASPPFHVHAGLDDSFYVLEGRLVVRCGDYLAVATAGSWVPFPRRVPHTFRVMDGRPARVLGVNANDSFLTLVRELGEPAPEKRLPGPTGGPGREQLDRLLAVHDITNVGPSMSEEEAQGFLDMLGA